MKKIVLYCKSYQGDIERIKVLKESILKYNQENLDFYISVPKQDINLFKNKLGSDGYKLLEDELIINVASHTPWLKKKNLLNHGWLNQQIVKSSFWKLNLADNYLCIDSDSYFIRNFKQSDFLNNDNTPYQLTHANKDFWIYLENSGKIAEKKFYFNIAKKIYDFFGSKYTFPFSFGPTPVVWNNKVWKILETKYLQEKQLDFSDLIQIAPFELNWYGECLLKEKPFHYIPIDSFFKCYHYEDLYRQDIDNGITEKLIAKNYLGIVMQSTWNPPLKFEQSNSHNNVISELPKKQKSQNCIKNKPLVSIGIPTYNRANSLPKAIQSAIDQSYSNLEIIISDNFSSDATFDICQEFSQQDTRIKYTRQSQNLGPIANFEAVLQEAQGEFFMWLADDDDLDENYISYCLDILLKESDYSLVCGKTNYFLPDGKPYREGVKVNIDQNLNSDRLINYYNQVSDNGTFYGLMRRDSILKTHRQNTLGSDWLFIAQIAYLGKIKTLENTYINRTWTWDKNGNKRIVASHKLPLFQAKYPYLNISIKACNDIVQTSPVYNDLENWEKKVLAWEVQKTICARYKINLHFNLLILLNLADLYQTNLENQEILEEIKHVYRKLNKSPLSEEANHYLSFYLESPGLLQKLIIQDNSNNPQIKHLADVYKYSREFEYNANEVMVLNKLTKARDILAEELLSLSEIELQQQYGKHLSEIHQMLLNININQF